MTLTAGQFLRAFYWRLRSSRKEAAHMLGVLPGFAANALRLLVTRTRHRRPLLAIALVEHMGDIVAAEPVARLARATHPEARVVWVTRAPYAALPASYPAVDAVLRVRCMTEWLLLRGLGLIDVVWDLHLNRRACPLCCIPLVRAGRQRLPELATYFEFGNLLAVQCCAAGLPPLSGGPALAPPPAAVAAVDALALPRRFVAIHCASNEACKDWPAEKWRALLGRLLQRPDLAVVEVGLAPVAIAADGPRQRSLCGRLSILETAEAIRRAELFIGIDSGPAHLASAVATPGVILLGRFMTFPRYVPFSGDYANGVRATLLHAEGPAAALPVDAVFAAAMARLPAAPAVPAG